MVQFPQVNLNGTSKDALLEQYRRSYRAINAAIESLCEGAPHGRDYQTLPPGAVQLAIAEHRIRVAKLESVRAEIEAIALHIQE